MTIRYKQLAIRGVTFVSSVMTGFFLANHFADKNMHVMAKKSKKKKKKKKKEEEIPEIVLRGIPTRQENLASLKSGEQFDLLIIGGGVMGAGCALDAASRGLKTALVDANDFSCGSSSRGTKLIYGGMHHLRNVLFNLDYHEFFVVRQYLRDRARLLANAPHLTDTLPLMIPVYSYWRVPYTWLGVKIFDSVSGSLGIKPSHFISKKKSLELFPMLKQEKLRGSMVYYDAQMNDARVNLALITMAARYGATMANHVRVVDLVKGGESRRMKGVRVRDELGSGEEWEIKAKLVINATGPFVDSIRKMDYPDDPKQHRTCYVTAGVHVVLPGFYSPEKVGILNTNRKFERSLFILPWEKHTIAGATDAESNLTASPAPTEDDVQFILKEVSRFLHPDIEVRRGDVLAAWSGLRCHVTNPYARDPEAVTTRLFVNVSPNGLMTISGGNITSYRSNVKHVIDMAVVFGHMIPLIKKCQTEELFLDGGKGWTPTMYTRLVQDFGLECDVAHHLSRTYGTRAFSVAKYAANTGRRMPAVGIRVHPQYPYIDAEVRYVVHKEFACSAVDVIARRLRLAFLNVDAALEALPFIVDIMAKELKWDKQEKKKQMEEATKFLQVEMGQIVKYRNKRYDKLPIVLSEEETAKYTKTFHVIDNEKMGLISMNDVRKSLRSAGEDIAGEELHEILRNIDSTINGLVDLEDYLRVMTVVKHVEAEMRREAAVRMALIALQQAEAEKKHAEKFDRLIEETS